MKKTILLTSFAALTALSSCTMDEIKEVNQGTPIGFRTSVATRGIEATQISNLKYFYCTAWTIDEEETIPYFEDLYFEYIGSYKSSPTYYWPKGKNLSFYAYTPGINKTTGENELGENAVVNIGRDAQTITGYHTPENIDEQDDLIFAKAENQQEQPSIALSFAHMLSKIDVYAQSSYPVYEYKFKGVKIGGINTTGNVDLATATWSGQSNVGKCTKEFAANEDPVQVLPTETPTSYRLLGQLPDYVSYPENNYAFVIPQEFKTAWDPETDPNHENGGAYISVLVQINTIPEEGEESARVYPQEGEYGWVAVPIPAGKWEAGYQYNYYLDFSHGAGYVDPDDIDPEGGVTGGSILGSPIKITMKMTPIQDAESGVFTNEGMAGIWQVDDDKRVEKHYNTGADGTKVLNYTWIETYQIIGEEGQEPQYVRTEETTYYDLTNYEKVPELNEGEDINTYFVDGKSIYKKNDNTGVTDPEPKYFDNINSFYDEISTRIAYFGHLEVNKTGTKASFANLETDFYIVKENVDDDEDLEYVMYIDAFKNPDTGIFELKPTLESLTPAVDANTPGEAYTKTIERLSSWEYEVATHYTISHLDTKK